jgi:DNA-binding response OmpR family regulator
MRKLLLVEDDPAIGKALQITLGLEGYNVSLACTAAAAHEALGRNKFDIFVLDITLPDGNGLDLCRKVREENPGVPIVMVTGTLDEATQEKARQAGANDYVSKPFSTSGLAARLRQALPG